MQRDVGKTVIGVVTEQGDLGLGFRPIDKKDQKAINENMTDKNDHKEGRQEE